MVKEARVFSVRMARNSFHFFGSDVSVTVIVSGVNFVSVINVIVLKMEYFLYEITVSDDDSLEKLSS